MWRYTGQERPDFALDPEPGQESVWDYPRPPRCEQVARHVRVHNGERQLARTSVAIRVLETASPPTYYLPPSTIDLKQLVEIGGSSFCEWKGAARYFALRDDARRAVAWSYPSPSARFSDIANFLSFYPALVACYVNDEPVRPQPGGFYGGWVTDEIVGPFKGEGATGHW